MFVLRTVRSDSPHEYLLDRSFPPSPHQHQDHQVRAFHRYPLYILLLGYDNTRSSHSNLDLLIDAPSYLYRHSLPYYFPAYLQPRASPERPPLLQLRALVLVHAILLERPKYYP